MRLDSTRAKGIHLDPLFSLRRYMQVVSVSGDMFASECEALVNTVNCVGTMGRGLARQFRDRFPENNERYVHWCKLGMLMPGKIFAYREGGKLIVNFPTKAH